MLLTEELIDELWPRRRRSTIWLPRQATPGFLAPTTLQHLAATAVALCRPPTMHFRMIECVSGLRNSAGRILSQLRCQRRHPYFVGVGTQQNFSPPLEGEVEDFFTDFPTRARERESASTLGDGNSQVLQGRLDLSPCAPLLNYKIFTRCLVQRGGLLLFGTRFRPQSSLLGSRFRQQASLLGSRSSAVAPRLGPALLQ